MQTHARMFGVEAILIVPLGIAGARLPYAVSSPLGRPGQRACSVSLASKLCVAQLLIAQVTPGRCSGRGITALLLRSRRQSIEAVEQWPAQLPRSGVREFHVGLDARRAGDSAPKDCPVK